MQSNEFLRMQIQIIIIFRKINNEKSKIKASLIIVSKDSAKIVIPNSYSHRNVQRVHEINQSNFANNN